MAIFQCKFKSQSLGNNTDVTVFIPYESHQAEKTDCFNKYKVLYLLHGYSGDNQDWSLHTNVIRYANEKKIAVVMPNAWESFYCDMKNGKAFWTYISEELPSFISSMFPISEKREDTFAAGLSMGGYGAVKLGLKNPERFCAIASLSGVLDLSCINLEGQIAMTFSNVFGDGYKKEDEPTYWLQQCLSSGKHLPDLYIACGSEDFLYTANQNFINKAKELNVNIKYEEEKSAGHEWKFWDKYIKRVIDWLPVKDALV